MTEVNRDSDLTDISKCGPPAPGKKWVQVKKTDSGMGDDGSFYSKDYFVWEQVDDDKQRAKKSMGAKPEGKRAPPNTAPKGKQTQAGLASFFSKK
jgi:hypothetical protein